MIERPILVYTTYTDDPGLSAAPLGINEPLVYWSCGLKSLVNHESYDRLARFTTERAAWIGREKRLATGRYVVKEHPYCEDRKTTDRLARQWNCKQVVVFDELGNIADSWEVA